MENRDIVNIENLRRTCIFAASRTAPRSPLCFAYARGLYVSRARRLQAGKHGYNVRIDINLSLTLPYTGKLPCTASAAAEAAMIPASIQDAAKIIARAKTR